MPVRFLVGVIIGEPSFVLFSGVPGSEVDLIGMSGCFMPLISMGLLAPVSWLGWCHFDCVPSRPSSAFWEQWYYSPFFVVCGVHC